MIEYGVDVKHYEDYYECSNLGRIRNKITGNILKGCINNKGYVRISLTYYKTKKFAHVLILESFYKRPFNNAQVNHIDENKTNNKLDNLEWVTNKQNANHGTRIDRVTEKIKKPIFCITNNTEYPSIKDAGNVLGISPSSICNQLQGRLGYHCKGHRFVRL